MNKRILLKMFKADIKKHIIFISCNIVAIMVFFSFLWTLLNQDFMRNVDSMIASNIYLPSFLTFLFMIIFIPFSNFIFSRMRIKNYGIFYTIGMTLEQISFYLSMEILLISVISLILGLVAGTILSFVFYFVIHAIIGVSELHYMLNVKVYEYASIFYMGIAIVCIILNNINLMRRTSLDLLKSDVKPEGSRKESKIGVVLGCFMFLLSLVILILFYNVNSNIFFVSVFICLLGTVLILVNVAVIIQEIKEKNFRLFYKNLYFFSMN